MKGYDLNIALTVFYVCVCYLWLIGTLSLLNSRRQFTLIEVPSNLLLKRVGSIWVAYLVIAFGAVALGSAFVRTYKELIVTRVFLGIAEGGTLVGLRLVADLAVLIGPQAGLVYTLARVRRSVTFEIVGR